VNTHYFSADEPGKSNIKPFSYFFGEYQYFFDTDIGVFSVGKMDKATEILLKNIPPLRAGGSLLDMGCGFGCIGIILAKANGIKNLTQADINPRAVRLTADNARKNGVTSNIIQSDKFSNIPQLFDTIVINPPIHAGKKTVFELYKGANEHLNLGGCLYIVIHKKHGAESSVKYLGAVFGKVEVLYRKGGVYVVESTK